MQLQDMLPLALLKAPVAVLPEVFIHADRQ